MTTTLHLEPIPALSDNYIWIAADDHGRALAVDPGEAEPVLAALAARGWVLTTILLTHHHADHTGGVAAIKQHCNAQVFAPRDDRMAYADVVVGDGDQVAIDVPRVDFNVIAVPGHTRSHVAYSGAGILFCGDTLFSLGCGRIFEGTPAQMLASLDRLCALPGATRVCCAHEYTLGNAAFAMTVDPDGTALKHRVAQARAQRARGEPTLPTRLDDELAANPFLRLDDSAIRAWAKHSGAGPERVDRFAALRQAKDTFRG